MSPRRMTSTGLRISVALKLSVLLAVQMWLLPSFVSAWGYTGKSNSCQSYDQYSPINFQNCEDTMVQLSSVAICCDSPYTFYWGNGAHRSSYYCDSGDKASVSICFDVTEDLDAGETIFMTMGISASENDDDLLYALRAEPICKTMVGRSCAYAGSYCFQFQATFDTLYDDEGDFVPVVEIGFSTLADEGYNLGGVNIDCYYDEGYNQYDPWLHGDKSHVAVRGEGSFLSKFGILLGVLVCVGLFSLFTYSTTGGGTSRAAPRRKEETSLVPRIEGVAA